MVFAIVKGVAVSAQRVQCTMGTSLTTGSGNVIFNSVDTAANLWQSSVTPQGGAQDTAVITSPAHTTDWVKRTTRYVAGVAPVHRINGTAVTPAYAVAVGLAATIESLALGHLSVAGGSLYMLAIFEAVGTAAGAACLSEENAIHYYINQQTGL
jgi:hypothetical protein